MIFNLVIIRLAEELKTIKPDYNKMASKLADAKKNLEDETLKRIDLQNQLQTMQEEHKFENSILEQQLNETRTRKQIEIEEVDSRVSTEYEQKLQSSLQVNSHSCLQSYLIVADSCHSSRSSGTRMSSRWLRTRLASARCTTRRSKTCRASLLASEEVLQAPSRR